MTPAGALDHEELLHVELEMRPQDVHNQTHCQRSSILVVFTLEWAFNLDAYIFRLFLRKDNELRTECRSQNDHTVTNAEDA